MCLYFQAISEASPTDIKEVDEKRDEEAPPRVGTSDCDGCKRTIYSVFRLLERVQIGAVWLELRMASCHGLLL